MESPYEQHFDERIEGCHLHPADWDMFSELIELKNQLLDPFDFSTCHLMARARPTTSTVFVGWSNILWGYEITMGCRIWLSNHNRSGWHNGRALSEEEIKTILGKGLARVCFAHTREDTLVEWQRYFLFLLGIDHMLPRVDEFKEISRV